MNSDVLSQNEVFSAMERDTPYASYIKTILGKVAVTVWDSALEKPVDVILQGNPKNKDEGCIVKVWSEKENSVFKRMNNRHFKSGVIRQFEIPAEAPVEKRIEQASDEELKAIIDLKYYALLDRLNKIESVAVLFRMKNLADEMEKSAKIVGVIEKRISEVQTNELIGQPKSEEE